MRKIEERMIECIEEGINMNCGNTQVVKTPFGIREVRLHGITIAEIDDENDILKITNCGGCRSQATKSRINALLTLSGSYIYQRNFEWFYCDGTPFRPMQFNL